MRLIVCYHFLMEIVFDQSANDNMSKTLKILMRLPQTAWRVFSINRNLNIFRLPVVSQHAGPLLRRRVPRSDGASRLGPAVRRGNGAKLLRLTQVGQVRFRDLQELFVPHLVPDTSLGWGSIPSDKTSYQSTFPVPSAISCPLFSPVPPCNQEKGLWRREVERSTFAFTSLQ